MVLSAKSPKDDKVGIRAFYTLSHARIERETLFPALTKKLPRYPGPVMSIAQLAVDKEAPGQGRGKAALIRAVRHCLEINAYPPSYTFVVDVLDRHDGHIRLYLPMKRVVGLFS